MAYFTEDNTDGFTAAELKTLNAAFEAIEASSDADASNIGDRINNAYYPGITTDELIAAAGF